MKTLLVMSAGSKKDLQQMINEMYYSYHWIIRDDGSVYNTKTEKVLENRKVEYKRNRWRLIDEVRNEK